MFVEKRFQKKYVEEINFKKTQTQTQTQTARLEKHLTVS
jgi:hypothetical protein